MSRYYWDFRGRTAKGTADHFAEHLVEFLEREHLAGCQTGVTSPGERHSFAWCLAPDEHRAVIERALKPHRSDTGDVPL